MTSAPEDRRALFEEVWRVNRETNRRLDQRMADERIIEELERGEARTLRLQPGERFIGAYVGLRRATTTYRGKERPCWVAQFADDNGELVEVWLLSKVLLSKLTILAPKRGERVGIKALGKVEGRGGSYNDWRVAADRPPVGWQEVGVEDAPDE